MNTIDEVCPVVFRDPSMRQILACEHPQAGIQLVKGGIGPGETVRAAALRELQEAGISNTGIAHDLGTWEAGQRVWSLQLCTFPQGLPETWTRRRAAEDGQHLKFFWHDVHQPPDESWADHCRAALETIRERTRPLRWRG
jgi:8-oxo-dGTP pyrophosphatase MutT (NUDIX family)